CMILYLYLLLRRHPCSTPFPYTTLFRSVEESALRAHRERDARLHRARDDRARRRFLLHARRRLRRGGREVLRLVALRGHGHPRRDRKSTRLNSSHLGISYAVFCLKKKKY